MSISPLWLAEGSGPRVRTSLGNRSNIIAIHPEDDLAEGTVQIEEYKGKFRRGNGNKVVTYEREEDSEPATYRLLWMQKQRLNVKHLNRFKVSGDSMEPLLFSGDSVLVNLAECEFEQIKDGKIYAIRYGDDLRVKRLFRKLDGGLTLRSYNQDHKDEGLTP